MRPMRFERRDYRSTAGCVNLKRRFWISAAIIAGVSFMMFTPFIEAAEQKIEKTQEQKLLERYAAESLYRLKQSVKNDGFFNARVALNIWESNAIDAGNFDQALYDEFKAQIYKKSIQENLKWFDIFVKQKDYSDARTCLKMWRIHSEEIGVFDEEKYNEMKERLQ